MENPLVSKLKRSGVLLQEDYDALIPLCASPRRTPGGTIVIEQGQRLIDTPLIVSGFAFRYRLLENGNRQIVGILLPGDFCDLQGTILGRSDHFTATLSTCSIVWVSPRAMNDLTLARSRIAQAMWWSTLVDECILRTWLTAMGQRPAEQAFAHFCCELLLRLEVIGLSDGESCEVPLTQGDLADILGITNVHVNRVLKQLRAADLLQFKGRRLTVPSVARLREFCRYDAGYLHLKEAGSEPHEL